MTKLSEAGDQTTQSKQTDIAMCIPTLREQCPGDVIGSDNTGTTDKSHLLTGIFKNSTSDITSRKFSLTESSDFPVFTMAESGKGQDSRGGLLSGFFKSPKMDTVLGENQVHPIPAESENSTGAVSRATPGFSFYLSRVLAYKDALSPRDMNVLTPTSL